MIEDKDLQGLQDFFQILNEDVDNQYHINVDVQHTGIVCVTIASNGEDAPILDLQGDKFMTSMGTSFAQCLSTINRIAESSVRIYKEDKSS